MHQLNKATSRSLECTGGGKSNAGSGAASHVDHPTCACPGCEPFTQLRNLPAVGRRPAPGQPGTLRQQFETIILFLESQSSQQRTGAERKRVWDECHYLAKGSSFKHGVQS